MKTITQMREEIGTLMENLGKMKAQVLAENREPDSKERRKATEILDLVDELEKNIAMDERIQETSQRLAEPQTKPIKPDVKNTSLSHEDQKRKDSFLSLGEQLEAVLRAGSGIGPVDPRLQLQTRAISGLGEAVSSDGGLA